jgi:proline reductase-associated electron transfer protein PrdC
MRQMYCFPLIQGIGAKAAPTVVKGDNICRGQLLAYIEEGKMGCPIYSSVSGIVKEVSENEIVIDADEKQEATYIKLTETEPLKLIQKAGIVGLGGAGFPTYVKLSGKFQGEGTVIINAAECEPILEHNIRAIEENPKQLLRGLEIAMDITGAKRGIIAIKEIHEKAITKLKEALGESEQKEKIRVTLLPNMYPMGEERALIRETLGKLLSVTSLPLEADAIVINAETACRIQEAVDLKKPLIDKNMTVAGKIKGCEKENIIKVLMDVPIGKSVGSILDEQGGCREGYGEIIMGGPFTGKRTEPDKPVVKTTGGLIVTECFPKGPEKIGLLVCACGADEKRLREIAESLGSSVVGVESCKQAIPVKNTLKCENPGKCPGQVQKIMKLKKAGAQAVLISNCTDCSNTVMSCAPKLGLPVYHCTDQANRAVNIKLIRKIH